MISVAFVASSLQVASEQLRRHDAGKTEHHAQQLII